MFLDTELINRLEDAACTLECVDNGDDDYSWAVIGYYIDQPKERYIAFGSTIREALQIAADRNFEALNEFNNTKNKGE